MIVDAEEAAIILQSAIDRGAMIVERDIGTDRVEEGLAVAVQGVEEEATVVPIPDQVDTVDIAHLQVQADHHLHLAEVEVGVDQGDAPKVHPDQGAVAGVLVTVEVQHQVQEV